MINTADGALIEVTNMLQRMRELALQASNGTTTSADRSYLSSEYANLLSEIDRIAENTQWNGMNILAIPPQQAVLMRIRLAQTVVRQSLSTLAT